MEGDIWKSPVEHDQFLSSCGHGKNRWHISLTQGAFAVDQRKSLMRLILIPSHTQGSQDAYLRLLCFWPICLHRRASLGWDEDTSQVQIWWDTWSKARTIEVLWMRFGKDYWSMGRNFSVKVFQSTVLSVTRLKDQGRSRTSRRHDDGSTARTDELCASIKNGLICKTLHSGVKEKCTMFLQKWILSPQDLQ